jgi:hypothetical protein
VLASTAFRLAFANFRATNEKWTRLNDSGETVSFRSTYQRVVEQFQLAKELLSQRPNRRAGTA